MKKIIISAIIILVVITGIICFALYSKNIKLDKTSESGTNYNKIEIKDNDISDDESNIDETIEESPIQEEIPKPEVNRQPEEKKENKKSDNSTKNNNTKQNTTVVEEKKQDVKKEAWEELGISEYDYYHKPMWSWARVDFSIDEYKTEQKTKEACESKGQEYFEQGLGYSCTSINSYAGTYLGEMLKTF